jgi:hypothetical protein
MANDKLPNSVALYGARHRSLLRRASILR